MMKFERVKYIEDCWINLMIRNLIKDRPADSVAKRHSDLIWDEIATLADQTLEEL